MRIPSRRLLAVASVLWLVALLGACGDEGVTSQPSSTTEGQSEAAGSKELDEFVEAAVDSLPPDQVASFGGEGRLRCLYAAYVEAIGYEELVSAGIGATEYGVDPMASSYGLKVDEGAASVLRAEVLRCIPDPVEMFIDAVLAAPNAISPGYEDTFADCYREAITVDQAVDDIVADFVEPHGDDLPTDLAYFGCAGTVDT